MAKETLAYSYMIDSLMYLWEQRYDHFPYVQRRAEITNIISGALQEIQQLLIRSHFQYMTTIDHIPWLKIPRLSWFIVTSSRLFDVWAGPIGRWHITYYTHRNARSAYDLKPFFFVSAGWVISTTGPRYLVGRLVDLQLAVVAVVVVENIAERLAPHIAAAVPGNVAGRESKLKEYNSRTIIIYAHTQTQRMAIGDGWR